MFYEKYGLRKHIYFSGRVQGVGFRYRSYYIAQSLGLTGWVTNLWDGRVEGKWKCKDRHFEYAGTFKTYPGTKLDRSIRYGDHRYPL